MPHTAKRIEKFNFGHNFDENSVTPRPDYLIKKETEIRDSGSLCFRLRGEPR